MSEYSRRQTSDEERAKAEEWMRKNQEALGDDFLQGERVLSREEQQSYVEEQSNSGHNGDEGQPQELNVPKE